MDSVATPPPAVFRICFVCTGNICRSPMAEAIFRDLVRAAGLGDHIAVTSAGTGDWHVGEHADPRAIAALADRGFDASRHRARQFDPAWFAELDLVVAFDRAHERSLAQWAPDDIARAKIALLLGFDPDAAAVDVPDPYYSDAQRFDEVLGMIERACRSFFTQLEPAIRRGAA